MAARLMPLGEGPTILLDRPIIFVGRHPDCDVRIESRKVSRRHCFFALVKDRLFVRDLGSTNGIQHNGRRVREAAIGPEDEIVIGDLPYQLVLEDEDGEGESPEQQRAKAPGSAEEEEGLPEDDSADQSPDEGT